MWKDGFGKAAATPLGVGRLQQAALFTVSTGNRLHSLHIPSLVCGSENPFSCLTYSRHPFSSSLHGIGRQNSLGNVHNHHPSKLPNQKDACFTHNLISRRSNDSLISTFLFLFESEWSFICFMQPFENATGGGNFIMSKWYTWSIKHKPIEQ